MNSYTTCPRCGMKVGMDKDGKFLCANCKQIAFKFLEVKGAGSYITCPDCGEQIEKNKDGKFDCPKCKQEKKSQSPCWGGK